MICVSLVSSVCDVCCAFTCVSEKLKFTPTPQPSQCLELDKEIPIQCSAKGREPPTIRWSKTGLLPLIPLAIASDLMRNGC